MLLSIPTGGSSSSTVSSAGVTTSKRVVFTIPLIDKLIESSMEYSNTEAMRRSSLTSPEQSGLGQGHQHFSPPGSTSSSPHRSSAPPTSSTPMINPLMMNYPHTSNTSNEITAIAVASTLSVFAAADSNGLISLWYLPRNPNLGNCSIKSSVSNPNGLKKLLKRLKLYIITVLNIKQCDSFFTQQTEPSSTSPGGGGGGGSGWQSGTERASGKSGKRKSDSSSLPDIKERIIKLKFLASDLYLLVCTNRRMLLLAIQYQQFHPQYGGGNSSLIANAVASSLVASSSASSTSSSFLTHYGPQSFEEAYSRGNSMDLSSIQSMNALKAASSTSSSSSSSSGSLMPQQSPIVRNVIGFSGWVELDRSVPRCYAMFDFFISDEYYESINESGKGSSTGGLSRKIVQWRAAEIDDEDEGKDGFKSPTTLLLGKKKVSSTSSSTLPDGILRKCTISRLQWTENMFEAALAKLKPCPVYLPFDN
jgi:hypothetical protein